MFVILLLLDLFLHSHGQQITHASLQINSTWESFCKEETSFKSSLSNYISYRTQIVTRPYQLLFLNADTSCKDPAQSPVYLSVSITYPAPNNANQDLDMLSRMIKLLENGAMIGGMQVISAKLVKDSGSSTPSIGPKTVLIIIGVVLAVYLLGYCCVIFSQSDSYDSSKAPSVYTVSTVNKEYEGHRPVHAVETIGDKRL